MTWHARRLFIVSREQPGLYEHARAVFAGTPGIEVIYDRRLRERRQGGSAAGRERRQRTRRVRSNVDAEVVAFGSAILAVGRTPGRMTPEDHGGWVRMAVSVALAFLIVFTAVGFIVAFLHGETFFQAVTGSRTLWR